MLARSLTLGALPTLAAPLALAAVLALAVPGPARAQDDPDVDRDPHGSIDGPRAHDHRTPMAPGALAATSSALMTFRSGMELRSSPELHPPSRLPWRLGIGFDEPVRDLLQADPAGQRRASAISDVLLYAAVTYTAGVDAGLAPLVQGDLALLWQAQTATWLALGITQSLGELVKRAAGRERPFVRRCEEDPDAFGCDSHDASQSFFSMHSATTWTAAGVSCALHLERDLYRDGVADALSCAASVALATTTAALRLVADRHYVSDVLVGSALGFAIGYLTTITVVPARGADAHGAPSGPTLALTPMINPSALTGTGPTADGVIGLSAFGTF